MILVDTSVWIDHLRNGDLRLAHMLENGRVMAHPCVIGELALGNLKNRETVIGTISELPMSPVATDSEVIEFIERNALFGQGIGYVDAHLLAAVRLAPGTLLWTRDKRLNRVAQALGLAVDLDRKRH